MLKACLGLYFSFCVLCSSHCYFQTEKDEATVKRDNEIESVDLLILESIPGPK